MLHVFKGGQIVGDIKVVTDRQGTYYLLNFYSHGGIGSVTYERPTLENCFDEIDGDFKIFVDTHLR